MSDSANNHIPYVPQNTLDPAAGLNEAIRVIDALLNTRVESLGDTTPPSSEPADGTLFAIGTGATGEWAGHDHALAQYDATAAAWTFYEAGVTAWLFLNKADGNLYKWGVLGGAWIIAAGLGDAPADGNYYGRQNNIWAAMPDVSNMVTSVDGQSPDSLGNVALEAPDVPYTPASATGLTATDVAGALNEVGQRGTVGLLNGVDDHTASSYNLQLTDIGKELRLIDSSAASLVVPPHSSVAFPIGAWILFSQGGAGAVTATPGDSSVVIDAPNGDSTSGLEDARGLQQRAIDVWRVW